MQVTQEQISPCEIDLRIEVEAEKVNSAIDESYKELSRSTKIPGFRPGKAPRPVLERFIGEDRVKGYAKEKLIPPAYTEALEETKIDPWALPDLEVVEFEQDKPMVFKAKVPLAPKVELGDYVGLEIERKVEPVTDQMVDDEVNHMLEQRAHLDPVTDRGVQERDTVVIDLSDEAKPEEEPKRQVVLAGDNVPDFDKGLLGMNLEEEKVIEVTYPEDHPAEEIRGTSASLKVKVAEIYERHLPELNDEWVKTTFAPEPREGEESPADADAVDTVDKLRERVRSAIEKAAQDVAESDVLDKVVGKVIENSKIDYPEVMVTERVEERLAELTEELKKREVTLDDYLKRVGKTLEELRSDYANEAREGLKVNLVIYEVAEKESIKVEDADIDAEIKRIAEERRTTPEAIRAMLDRGDGVRQISYRLLRKKTLDFLVGASNIKSVG